MTNRLLITLAFALYTSCAVGQFKKIKSIALSDTITYAAVDRPGELYLIYSGGMLERYNEEGALQQRGTLPFHPLIFDPRDGSRLFASDPKTRQFMVFSPYDLQQPTRSLDSAFAISPVLTCSSGDYDLLTLDSADWSLKKISLKTNRVMFETILGDKVSELPSLKFMREYQNFVFIVDDQKGIYIFNMLGNLLQFLPVNGLMYIGFLGEELYYLENNELVFFDLFTADSRKMKLPSVCEYALLTDQRLYIVHNRELRVFSVKP